MNKKIPLTCPCKFKKSLKKIKNLYLCKSKNCKHNKLQYGFPIYKNKPILISEIKTDTIFKRNNYKTYIERPFFLYIKN